MTRNLLRSVLRKLLAAGHGRLVLLCRSPSLEKPPTAVDQCWGDSTLQAGGGRRGARSQAVRALFLQRPRRRGCTCQPTEQTSEGRTFLSAGQAGKLRGGLCSEFVNIKSFREPYVPNALHSHKHLIF